MQKEVYQSYWPNEENGDNPHDYLFLARESSENVSNQCDVEPLSYHYPYRHYAKPYICVTLRFFVSAIDDRGVFAPYGATTSTAVRSYTVDSL